MASHLFDDLLLKGIRAGQIPAREKSARDWYRDKAKSIRISGDRLIKETTRDRLKNPQNFQVGSMFIFTYDAKHKATLPYYDRFPLVFPLGVAKGGFLGINWHYLPHTMRARLMDALYETINNDRYDESTKMKISYGILNNAVKFSPFKPALKHYLFSHVRSRLVYIHPSEWDIALFTPTSGFVGASQSKVWADSRAALRKK